MAGIGVQVHRIDQIAANKVDAVKILTEFDQILAGFAFRAFLHSAFHPNNWAAAKDCQIKYSVR